MVTWLLRGTQTLLVLFAIVLGIIGVVWVSDPGEAQTRECYVEQDASGPSLRPDMSLPDNTALNRCFEEWDATKQGLTMGVVALAMGVCAIALHPAGQAASARAKTGKAGRQPYAGYQSGQYQQPPGQPGQAQQPPPGYRPG